MMTIGYPRPDWDYWKGALAVALSYAVALSMNIEPRCFIPYRYFRGGFATTHTPPSEYYERPALAQNCIYEALPATKSLDGTDQVRFGQFVDWAVSVGWSLPPELLG